MKIGKILKVAGIAFAGYAIGVWTTGYQIARSDKTKKAAEDFADAWDSFKSLAKNEGSKPVEETAEDISDMVSDAAEEVAEAVEEAASEVVPDITVTTSEESEDQPED